MSTQRPANDTARPTAEAQQNEIQRLHAELRQARTGAFAEAIDRLHSAMNLAPDPERAPGLNFAIGALMAMRDRAARTTTAPTTQES